MMNASSTVVHLSAGLLADGESPSLKPGLDANQVSPGVVGFLLTLLLAVLIILVALDHTRRQRRLKNRFDYAMAREAEEREAAGQDGTETATGVEESDPDPAAHGNQSADQHPDSGSSREGRI
ncbi:hypothetical protein [Rothia uropygialis]|uniref:hypothetical protein n=1 Tax=Kocuria sp. 36 TaxID=1415402 RepID=UPI0018754CB8|nr:hypothetical protein [Kocuria sp. 36]